MQSFSNSSGTQASAAGGSISTARPGGGDGCSGRPGLKYRVPSKRSDSSCTCSGEAPGSPARAQSGRKQVSVRKKMNRPSPRFISRYISSQASMAVFINCASRMIDDRGPGSGLFPASSNHGGMQRPSGKTGPGLFRKSTRSIPWSVRNVREPCGSSAL